LLVCASIYDYSREDREMIEFIKYYLGVAVNNGENYERTRRLTNELSFQNKLIQDQHEEMKKRLDEKTRWLNILVDYNREACLFALDLNGAVQLWSSNAEALFSISGSAATGKLITRLLDENHWPPITQHLQTARKEGTHTELFTRADADGTLREYELTMNCMHTEKSEPMGILCLIKEITGGRA
jgi:PAS domain S-box-containing protein